MKNLSMLLLPILIFQSVCHSAAFCVTTSAELQTAFDDANGNNQHNSIRIAEGNYLTPGSGFSYNPLNTNIGWDLEISGGWREFLGNPCGLQSGSNPYHTILDGNVSNRVMQIIAYGFADITINNLHFTHGLVGSKSVGAGLKIFSTQNDHTGNLKLERTAFSENEAGYSSAFSISGFNKIIIRNNLLIHNYAISQTTASVVQNNQYGVYFTNNTVLYNTRVNFDNNNGAGVYIGVSASSNAAIYNNLLWDNDVNDLQIAGDGKHYLISNDIGTRVGVAAFSQSGNFYAPPQFGFYVYSYIPAPNSPLFNAGIHPQIFLPIPTPFELAWGMGILDFLGTARVQDTRVDIGAFEAPPELPIFKDSFE